MNILYKTTTAILSLILSTNILPSTKPKTEDNNLIYCCSISYQVRFKFSCCDKGKTGDNKTKLDIKECLKSQKIQDNKPWFKNYYLSNKCDNLILAVKNCQLNLHQSKTSCFKKESAEFVNDEETNTNRETFVEPQVQSLRQSIKDAAVNYGRETNKLQEEKKQAAKKPFV